MTQIIPAILVHSAAEFESRLRTIEAEAPRIQIDVLDGTWQPEKSWADPGLIGQMLSPAHFELHLMVANPLQHLDAWTETTAVKMVYFHVEPVEDPKKVIEAIKFHGWQAGIAVAPETPLADVAHLLPYVDDILFLTVHPGASGRPFEQSVLEKIAECRTATPTLAITVDGALSAATIPAAKTAGATRFIVNGAIFNTPNPVAALATLAQLS